MNLGCGINGLMEYVNWNSHTLLFLNYNCNTFSYIEIYYFYYLKFDCYLGIQLLDEVITSKFHFIPSKNKFSIIFHGISKIIFIKNYLKIIYIFHFLTKKFYLSYNPSFLFQFCNFVGPKDFSFIVFI